jgi:hypothetical protein
MPKSDWKSLAKAYGLSLGPKELESVVQPLDALEQTFRPLVRDLSPHLEPALEFQAEAEAE